MSTMFQLLEEVFEVWWSFNYTTSKDNTALQATSGIMEKNQGLE